MSGRLPLHVNQQNGPWGVDLRMTMLPQKLAAAGYVSHLAGTACAGSCSGNVPLCSSHVDKISRDPSPFVPLNPRASTACFRQVALWNDDIRAPARRSRV